MTDNEIKEAAKAYYRTKVGFVADERFEERKAEFLARLESNDLETLMAALNSYSGMASGAESEIRKRAIVLADEIADQLDAQ